MQQISSCCESFGSAIQTTRLHYKPVRGKICLCRFCILTKPS